MKLGTFLYINLQSQIRGLLKKPGMASALRYPYTRHRPNPLAMYDVYDGAQYRRHAESGGFLSENSHNYSFAIWTDGISPSKTSPVTVWPVFLQVLELSPRARQRNTILAAVYVGPKKPLIAQFLAPVARELRDLRLNGVTWQPSVNEERTSRFMTLIASADSDARYAIFGMTRFNGHFGCTFCYVDGDIIGPGCVLHRLGNAADDRIDREIRKAAEEADRTEESQRGVTSMSALSVIDDFHLRIGQLVEAMHCLWEGNFTRLYEI